MENCVFCKIVRGELPSHKVWEDEGYYAFLSIYPNTEGLTLVIPKAHYGSDVFALPDEVLASLMTAAKTVSGKIDRAYEDVGRTGLVFEGYGVDHVHAKLYPMHGTSKFEWKPLTHESDKFFSEYEGYLSTHEPADKADPEWLANVAARIREA